MGHMPKSGATLFWPPSTQSTFLSGLKHFAGSQSCPNLALVISPCFPTSFLLPKFPPPQPPAPLSHFSVPVELLLKHKLEGKPNSAINMSDEIKNVIVTTTAHPTILPPLPDRATAGLSREDYQVAKNLRTVHLLIDLICQGSHGHHASFTEFNGMPPKSYSAKVSCTGDGTSWRVVMAPSGVKGMAWYFSGLKKLEGMFKTAVIRYWDAQQCESLVEAIESGGIESVPNNWRFVVHHDEVAGESENLAATSASQAAGTQDESMTATEVGNNDTTTEAEEEKSVSGL
ncbi:hypothetical protein B9Z19DRAFT_105971 [Tuber borchii]|uniref:Uncharacterized protein n=1 Tax=Tuber borchii TaxID=42251 RepID=A0A2T6ZRI4_TUBBO|nr:hypothetical protein B9Z19DRAFT_105971 [Tuber borchii]